jgi:hypothetical protein
MSSRQLHIQARSREHMSQIANLANFTWTDGGDTDAEQIITNPNISLYCLDDERQEAIFVALPDDIDLSRAPFVYQAQFENAQYLISVPYAIFFQLADKISVDTSRSICIHNVGRCGSTLLSQALNEVDGVIALSEPDVFANFVTIRHTSREQQIKLLQASFKFIYRPIVVGDASRYALKLRNQCADIMDVFIEAFPSGKHLFMYRNAMDWLASLYRISVKNKSTGRQYTRSDAIALQAEYLNRTIDEITPYFDDSFEVFSRPMYLAVSWMIQMIRYVEIVESEYEFPAIRYEDLMANRDATLSAIFTILALPNTAISQAQKAFQHDSQAGTRLARDNAQSGNDIKIPDTEITLIMQLLAKQDIINRPDIILSGTLSI